MDKLLKDYDENYYQEHDNWAATYPKISSWIYKNTNAQSYGDIGCGNAKIISYLHKKGKRVWGVDGSPSFLKFVDTSIKQYVKRVDLTESTKLEYCEVAICFEVAEHIQKKFADTLLNNIVGTKAETVMFTAAHPGQVGTNHVNLQPQSYWIKKFSNRGYEVDYLLTEKFKYDLDSKLQLARWYIENIMIFRKREKNKRGSIEREFILDLTKKGINLEKEKTHIEAMYKSLGEQFNLMINSRRWRAVSRVIGLFKK